MDSFFTIAKKGYGEYKEKGSKFLAYSYPLGSKDELESIFEELKGLHPKARHVCYAYRLGRAGEDYRANDDGEPSGSAGIPILNQLKSANLTHTFVAVIRYFGGTKLGVPGLINAYKVSTAEALSHSEKYEKFIQKSCQIDFEYGIMGDLLNNIKNCNFEIVSKIFEANPIIVISTRESNFDDKLLLLKSRMLKLPLEMITEKTIVEKMKITIL